MSAFFIATVKIKDQGKFQEYAQKAGASLKSFGGELLERGQARAVLAGSADHNAAAIIRFPTLSAVNDWYASQPYQAIIPLREEAADMTIVAYETPA